MLVSCSKKNVIYYMLQAIRHIARHIAAGCGFRESPEISEVMKPAAGWLAACSRLRADANADKNSTFEISRKTALGLNPAATRVMDESL
jgi:aconitase B